MADKIPVHPALVQPVLVAGAEREYTLLIALMAVMVWVAGKSLIAAILSVLIWVIGMGIGRMMAKKDAQGFKILLRHVKYTEYYPASEKLACPIKNLRLFEV